MSFLIVGADSRIGNALFTEIASRGQVVYGTTRRPISRATIRLDLTDFRLSHLPSTAITFLCAAITGHSRCNADPGMARKVNTLGPVGVANLMVARGGRVIFFSSAVAETAPGSVYGSTKLEAERQLSALGESVTVVRFGTVLPREGATASGPYEPVELPSLVNLLLKVSTWKPASFSVVEVHSASTQGCTYWIKVGGSSQLVEARSDPLRSA